MVIKFVNRGRRPCPGSVLNLCAPGGGVDHNSRADEQRANPGSGEADTDGFHFTGSIVISITMRERRESNARIPLFDFLYSYLHGD